MFKDVRNLLSDWTWGSSKCVKTVFVFTDFSKSWSMVDGWGTTAVIDSNSLGNVQDVNNPLSD